MDHTIFLVIHPTYEQLQIGLYSNNALLTKVCLDKKEASKYLIQVINTLLTKHTLSISDIEYIICNQGPGPYTTLRVALTTANGLAFNTKTNLIGVHALDTSITETQAYDHSLSVILLNAFNQEFYAIIIHEAKEIMRGCITLGQLFEKIDTLDTKPIHFYGNGALLYARELLEKFGNRAILENFLYPSIEHIAREGQKNFNNKLVVKELMPIYLKSAYTP